MLRKKNIEFKYAKWIIAGGGIIGSIAGSIFALKINPASLRKYFGIFLFLIGTYELFKKNRTN